MLWGRRSCRLPSVPSTQAARPLRKEPVGIGSPPSSNGASTAAEHAGTFESASDANTAGAINEKLNRTTTSDAKTQRTKLFHPGASLQIARQLLSRMHLDALHQVFIVVEPAALRDVIALGILHGNKLVLARRDAAE